jgi:hypothetical protein
VHHSHGIPTVLSLATPKHQGVKQAKENEFNETLGLASQQA